LQAFNPGAVPASGLFGGILFAILLFVGFETSASLGEETANPQRSIPRAVIGTVALAAVFFLLMIYACDIGYGLANTSKWASDSLALDTMANRYVGKWLAVLIDIAVFLDATAVMSAFMARRRVVSLLSRVRACFLDRWLPSPNGTILLWAAICPWLLWR